MAGGLVIWKRPVFLLKKPLPCTDQTIILAPHMPSQLAAGMGYVFLSELERESLTTVRTTYLQFGLYSTCLSILHLVDSCTRKDNKPGMKSA